VLKGKALGFTLREIREMVAQTEAGTEMPAGPSPGRPEPAPRLRLEPEIVRGQIAHLEQQKAEIEAALARLRGYDS
jgi:DNA-binding transcriptional MerR regulator